MQIHFSKASNLHLLYNLNKITMYPNNSAKIHILIMQISNLTKTH